MLILTYEYRIYPDAQQSQQMLDWLEQCRQVWNYALAERRDWIRSRSCRIDACSLKQEYVIPTDAPKPTYHYQQAQLTKARSQYPELAVVHKAGIAVCSQTNGSSFCGYVGTRTRLSQVQKVWKNAQFCVPSVH